MQRQRGSFLTGYVSHVVQTRRWASQSAPLPKAKSHSELYGMSSDVSELSGAPIEVVALKHQSPVPSANGMPRASGRFSSSRENTTLIDRMDSTGDTGDPYGSPACMFFVFPCSAVCHQHRPPLR